MAYRKWRRLQAAKTQQVDTRLDVAGAWKALALLKHFYQSNQISAETWVEAVHEARSRRIYEHIPPEAPYGSLEAMLRAEIGVGLAESVRIKSSGSNGTASA
jgi:hypothetical protein